MSCEWEDKAAASKQFSFVWEAGEEEGQTVVCSVCVSVMFVCVK